MERVNTHCLSGFPDVHLSFLINGLGGQLDSALNNPERNETKTCSQSRQAGPLSLVQFHRGFALIGCIMVLLMPALLCHKDTAQGNQSLLIGAFLAFRMIFMA